MGKNIEFPNICRACTTITPISSLHSIYNSSTTNLEDSADSSILEMMIAVSKTNLTPNDGLPEKICKNCLEMLRRAFEFQKMCQKSYEKLKDSLRTIVETEMSEKLTTAPEDLKDKSDLEMDAISVGINQVKEIPSKNVKSVTPDDASESSHQLNETDPSNELNDTDDIVEKKLGNLSKNIKTPSTRAKSTINYTCTECGKVFDRMYRLRRHLNVHKTEGRPYECNVCKQRFARESNLNRHRIVHTEMMSIQLSNSLTNKTDEIFRCSECNKEFNRPKSLASHMRTHKVAIDSKATTKVFTCNVCQKFFTKLNSLRRHERSHDEMKKLKCNLCDKTFTLSAQLIDHMNRHNGLKPHICHICNKGFQQSCTLKDHLRTHSGEQPFLCSECGKAFNNASNLRQHLQRHTGIKPYQCSECPSRFTSKGGLKSHMVTHSKVKPFICDICGSSFTKPYSLVKHKRIHTGEKPYACEVCDMRFNSSDHVKRHMRTHTGEKPYSCEFCKRSFAQSNDLVKHIRSHIGEKTYQCPQCSMAFRLHAELKEHIQEHFKQMKLCDNNNSNNSNEDNYDSRINFCKIDCRENFYECQNCSLIFPSVYDLHRHDCHQQNHQLNEVATNTNEILKISNGQNLNANSGGAIFQIKTETEQRQQHQCSHCPLVFANINDVTVHMNIVHCKSENIKNSTNVIIDNADDLSAWNEPRTANINAVGIESKHFYSVQYETNNEA